MVPKMSADDEQPFAVSVTAVASERSVMRLRGELDLASAPALAGIVEEQAVAGRRFLELELSGVTFCDAAGLGALAAAHVRLKNAGGRLVLRRPSRCLRRLLQLTHLDEVLLIEPARAGQTIGFAEPAVERERRAVDATLP